MLRQINGLPVRIYHILSNILSTDAKYTAMIGSFRVKVSNTYRKALCICRIWIYADGSCIVAVSFTSRIGTFVQMA